MLEILTKITSWLSPYYSQISMAIVATLLVIYGDVINKRIKVFLAPHHFIFRTIIFVAICAFGYGAIIIFSTPYVKQLLLMIPGSYRGLSIIFAFLLLGYLADNRRYI